MGAVWAAGPQAILRVCSCILLEGSMVPGTERFVVSDDGAYEAYRRALTSNDAGGVLVSFVA